MARIRGLVALLIVVTLGVIGWRIARDTPPGGAVPQTVPSQDAPQSTDAVADAARADLPKPVEHPAQPLPSDAVERDTARSDGLGSVGGAVRVTARIVDRDGAPLPDARAVWLPNTATLVAAGLSPGTWGTWMPSMQPPTPLDRLPQARGDAEGRVALDVRLVPADGEDEWWDDDPTMALPALLVMHPGRSTRIASAGKLEDGVGDLGEIVLLPEAVVTGRVVDEDGRPLAGLRIRLLSQHIEPGVAGSENVWQAGCVPELMQRLSPEDGRFVFHGLWPGRTFFELWAPDRVRRELECSPASGQSLDLGDITVERGSSIAGLVVDAGGAPISGATVSLVDGEIRGGMIGDMGYGYEPGDDSLHDELFQAEGNARHASVATDAAGAFRFEGLDSPTHTLYARAAGFEPARLREVAPGTTAARLVLQREAELRLTVIDRATREALVEAKVDVTRDSGVDSPFGDATLGVEARGGGVFVARGAGPRAQRVAVSAPGHAALVAEAPGVVAPASADFTVELGPEAVLAGRVLDDQGQPRAGATIELRAPGQARMPLLHVPAAGDGAFRIDRLGPVTVELVAFAPGAPDSAPLLLTVQEGQKQEQLEVRLPRPARIAGAVLKADGTPHAKTRVQLDVPPFGEFKFMEQSPRFTNWAVTDAEGRYAFEALAPGAYQVSVHGLPSVECTLAEGEARAIDFAASPTARVRGRVTSAGAPVAGVPVTASNEPEDRSQRLGFMKPAITDDMGDYVLELKAAGEVEVYVDPRGSPESAHRTVRLTPGQEAVADLELPAGRIAGRVVDDVDGAPIAGLDVSLVHDDGFSIGYDTTAEDGGFELRWLPPETYQLRLNGWGSVGKKRRQVIVSPEPRAIVLAAGATVEDFELRVCRGATLEGAVRLADGGPVKDGLPVLLVRTSGGRIVPGVRHMLSSGGDRPPGMFHEESPEPIFGRVSTDDGRYEFIALPPGEYRVLSGEAEAEQVLALGQPATLDEHETLELDLVAR